MRDALALTGKAVLIGTLLIPLGLFFLITKGLIWICDKILTKRK